MAIYLVIFLVIGIALEKYLRANHEGMFNNLFKYPDEEGKLHDTNYYYDHETGEYKKLEYGKKKKEKS